MATLRLAEVSIDRANELDEVPVMAEGQIDKSPVSHDIEFQNVHFAYEKRTILESVNFKIPDRTMTAIVGPSGSGKTTICNLIARFWDVNSGQVLIGGQDVKSYTLSELMSNISMVFKMYIFSLIRLRTISNSASRTPPMKKWLKQPEKRAVTILFLICLMDITL